MKNHIYETRIRESSLDTFGHVNNAEYLRLFEEARWEWITSNDYGMDEIVSSGLGPIILEVHLKFRRELRLREQIRIESKCVWYRKKLGCIEQKLFNQKGELSALATFHFGLFDTVNRKLVSPTEKWLKAISE